VTPAAVPDGAARPAFDGSRDALTHAGFGVLAAWAWFLYGFGPMLPLLRDEQGTSRTVMGLHSLVMSGGAVVAGLFAVSVVRRLRRRGATQLGVALVCLGVSALCLSPTPWLSVPSAFVTGLGGSMMLNASIASLADHHGPSSGAILSEGNAVAAGLGLVAPLAVGAGVALGLTWRPAILLVIPLGVLAVVLVRRVPPGWVAIDGEDGDVPVSSAALPRTFWFLLATVMATVAIEFCCTAWSADLLRQRAGLSAGAASAAVTLFVGGLFVGRVVAGRLARTRAPQGIVYQGLCVVVAGWSLLWATSAAGPGLVGLALLGLGMSVQYPLLAAMAYAVAAEAGDRASGALSLGVGTAAALAPFAVGAVADATSTHTAFLLVPIMTVLAAVLLRGHGRAHTAATVTSHPA
jgi:MFS family permease